MVVGGLENAPDPAGERVIVLGVDPSIAACGIGAVDRRTREVIDLATVRTDTSMTDAARFAYIYRRICSAIRSCKAQALAVEEQRFVQAGKRNAGKSHSDKSKTIVVYGLAIGAALAHGIPVFTPSPQQVKIAVLGKGAGNADKARVKAAVHRMLGTDERFSKDAADAVAAACAPSIVAIMAALRKA